MAQVQQSALVEKLRSDLMRLEGMRVSGTASVDAILGPLRDSFPFRTFPTGAVHEFLCHEMEDCAATSGFISQMLGAFTKQGGIIFWIGGRRTIFPPALKAEGIEPDRVVFVEVRREKDVIWTIDETLKCGALTAVVGQVHDLDFTSSRRMQLAAEHSGVTCFVVRRQKRNNKINPTACVSRWRITSMPSIPIDNLPGIGMPQWKVELLRIRNGRTGTWNLTYRDGGFVSPSPVLTDHEFQKKAG